MVLQLQKSREKAEEVLAKYKQQVLQDPDELADALEELLDAIRAEKTRKLSGEEIAELVCDHVNTFVRDDSFVKTMARKHRTLQQSFTRLCIEWFEELAMRTEDEYDLRNQASVELAKLFVEKIPPEKRTLPYI